MRVQMSLTTLILLIVTVVAAQDVTLRINEGLISGKLMTTRNGRQISGFIGIPYAEPPIGPLRFEPPSPKTPWLGVRQSLDKVNICPQIDVFTNQTLIQGDEDCLYLNVFTPQLANLSYFNSLPVMLYIHGGTYSYGSANLFQPNILLDRDIVLVVINYRLGALGFLTTGDNVVPGNNGLKDQNLALKWTKRNVRTFGGDPNRITIFGESVGGSSVHMHMMSPLSRGLFQAAISESGTALALWNFGQRTESIDISKRFAESFRCPSDNSVQLVECLRQQNAYDLIRNSSMFIRFLYDPAVVFKPIAEVNHPGAFLTQHPIHYIKSGNIEKIPWIVGINSEEGALASTILYSNPPILEQLNENFMSIIPTSVGYQNLVPDVNAITEKLRQYYFKDGINDDTVQNVTDFYTDAFLTSIVDASIRLHLRYVKEPIYYYLFSYRGRNSFTQIFGNPNVNYGVCHFDELLYLFPIVDVLFAGHSSPTDKRMARVLPKLWYNFARFGKPTRRSDGVNWRRVRSNDAMEYLNIKGPNHLIPKAGLYLKRVRFWRPIIDEILSYI